MSRLRNESSRHRRPPTSEEQVAVMRAAVKSDATDRPGVYRMLSADGEIVYVGKAKRLRSRLLSYFRCAFPEEKGARILREAVQIEWDYVPSEFAALLLELRLIKRFRPRFNVAMKKDARHYAFIKLTRGPAPRLMVVRGAGSDDGGTYYGPFNGARNLQEASRELADALGLRDCALDAKRMIFSDQRELFQLVPRTPGCIRVEVKKCLGPCVAACSAHDYESRVTLARAFLDGSDDAPMEWLRMQMIAASESLLFERAANFRDKLQRLEVLREQFGRLRYAVEQLSFVYAPPGAGGEERVYLVRRGCVRAEEPAPRSARERTRLRELAGEIFAGTDRASAQVPTHEIDEVLMLSSWFRRFPDEMGFTTTPERFLSGQRTA